MRDRNLGCLKRIGRSWVERDFRHCWELARIRVAGLRKRRLKYPDLLVGSGQRVVGCVLRMRRFERLNWLGWMKVEHDGQPNGRAEGYCPRNCQQEHQGTLSDHRCDKGQGTAIEFQQ